MREANLKRTAMASPGLRRLASLAALAMCVALAATGRAAADSGETETSGDLFEDVTAVTAADCNTIRSQIASGFSGDWIFICYRDAAANPACGLFATQTDQTNVLGYCQDRFPNGISPRLGSVLKTNVRILGGAIETTTGLVGMVGSTEVRSNVVCATYNPTGAAGGGRQICVQIDTTPTRAARRPVAPQAQIQMRVLRCSGSATRTRRPVPPSRALFPPKPARRSAQRMWSSAG